MPLVNGRPFSTMRHIKSYLSSTMVQAHMMVLHIHLEQLDELDLTAIANEFVSCSEQRLRYCTLENLLDVLTNMPIPWHVSWLKCNKPLVIIFLVLLTFLYALWLLWCT